MGETLEYQVFTKGLPIGGTDLPAPTGKWFRTVVFLDRDGYQLPLTLFYSWRKNLLHLDAQTTCEPEKVIKEKDKVWEAVLFLAAKRWKTGLVPGRRPISTYEAKHPLLEGLLIIT